MLSRQQGVEMSNSTSRVLPAVVAAFMLVSLAAVFSSARAGSDCFGRAPTRTVGSGARGDVYGTQGDDVIVGSLTGSGSTRIRARGGNDRVCVNTTGPLLEIYGQDDNDRLKGDRAQFFGGDGADVVRDWPGSGYAEGGAGPDRLFGGGGSGDSLYGQGGDDYLDVGAHGGYAYGGPGTDTCTGGHLFEAVSCEKN